MDSLYTYIKWHFIVMGKQISIDSLSVGKHLISSWYQYNKYSQSAFDKWSSLNFLVLSDPSSLEDTMN